MGGVGGGGGGGGGGGEEGGGGGGNAEGAPHNLTGYFPILI